MTLHRLWGVKHTVRLIALEAGTGVQLRSLVLLAPSFMVSLNPPLHLQSCKVSNGSL